MRSILDQNLNPFNLQESVPNPRHRTNLSPRLDYAVNKNNTLTARYQYFRDSQNNDGVGQFNLPSQGYNDVSAEHTFQIGDTQVIGASIVNETRFQYLRENDSQNAISTDPTINVRGAFGGGGNNQGTIIGHENHYEFQNYTSMIHQNHTLKFGGRVRALNLDSYSTSSFNGTFIFSSLNGLTDLNCHTPGDANQLPASTPCPVSYQYAQQQLQSGGVPYATQLSITTGFPNKSLTTYDAGLYMQDDWRARPNITLSYGLRFETQNYIHDRGDWAPRLGFAWGVGGRNGQPKAIVRGGFGIFYDRFQSEQILQAERVNGVVQQQYVLENPTCFPVAANCDLSAASTATPTVYAVEPPAARALHSAVGNQRGAAGDQVRDSLRHLFELARFRSTGHNQCECSVAGQQPPAEPKPRERLRVRLRIGVPAATTNRQQQRSRRIKAATVRLLHLELCQQQRVRRLELRFEFVQPEPGLRTSIVRYASPAFPGGKHFAALSFPAQPVHGGEFGHHRSTSQCLTT